MPVYRVPFVAQPSASPDPRSKRGCSLSSGNTHYEDIQTIKASWWQNWDASSGQYEPTPGFVATAWDGYLQYDIGASIIAWCNEPNNRDQAGANPELYNPVSAAGIFAQQRRIYGHRLWPAGVTTPNDGWFDRFIDALGAMGEDAPTNIHAHGYAEEVLNTSVDYCIKFWEHLHSLIPAPGNLLITEFGSTDGDQGKMREFLAWMEATPWVYGYAAFTNRCDDTASWYPAHWPHPYPGNLVDANGALTLLGQVYVENKT